MPNALAVLSVAQLKRAVEIKEQIDSLQNELDELLSGPRVGRPRGPGRPRLGRPPGSGKLSAAPKADPGNGRRGKRRMSKEWRDKIAAATKERWAKRKAQGKNVL
jgi:hypothetical protein